MIAQKNVQYRSKPHQKICGMKLLNTRGELELTKRVVAAAFLLWENAERGTRNAESRMVEVPG